MIAGHPHTVSSSRVPLYMQGISRRLGQDGTDFTIEPSTYDPGTSLVTPPDLIIDTTSELSPGGTLIAPAGVDTFTPSVSPQALAELVQSAAASGAISQQQANAQLAQLAAAGANVAKAATGIATAPSPRVAVPAVPGSISSLLSSSSIIKGIPDIFVIGGGLLAIAAMGKR